MADAATAAEACEDDGVEHAAAMAEEEAKMLTLADVAAAAEAAKMMTLAEASTAAEVGADDGNGRGRPRQRTQ